MVWRMGPLSEEGEVMLSDVMPGHHAVAGNAGNGQRGPGHWAAPGRERCDRTRSRKPPSLPEPARGHEQTVGGVGNARASA